MVLISLFSSCTSGRIEDESTLIKGLSRFPPAKWHQFGLELSVPVSTLKGFEHDYLQRGGGKRCLIETLEWWYNNTRGSATWGDICAALHAVEEGVLAAKVAKEHGKRLPILYFISSVDLCC